MPSRRSLPAPAAGLAAPRVLVALAVLGAAGLAALVWQSGRTPEPQPPPAASAPVAATPARPFGHIDAPAAATMVGPLVQVSGWALAPGGIDRVEIDLAGARRPARIGIARPDVASAHPGLPGAERAGFEFSADLGGQLTGRHELKVVAVARDGSTHELGRRTVVAAAPFARWRALLAARPALAADRFFLLPATSGVDVKGADGIRETYAPYESATMRIGVRVPILYLRTTTGRAGDWTFDPAWDFDRRCGERRIADDALDRVIATAVAQRLPVLFTLNGGVWGDASCDVPEWDVNDELEREPQNCQWTARDTVPTDHALRDLPGSQASPEIGRALTLNAYAARVRHYKKRNLQAAARVVLAFAQRHPELLVGVSLDPDVYILPWYGGAEWFDYNPGTLRQFRHWLRGDGPYAGNGGPGVPDLSAFRRAKPLSLAEVNAIAGRRFARWEEVEPPRSFPTPGDFSRQREWNRPWPLLWDQFRRHLVHVHYSELAAWIVASGIPPERVYTSQAFTAPDGRSLPQSVKLDDAATDHDSAGVSVEGAIPRQGRLGVILYGDAATNRARTATGEPLFRIFERMAGRWGAIEFSTADLKNPTRRPTYADGYTAFREILNAGGVLVSPMAWNGWNGIFAEEAGYQTYTSWRNTPAEAAALDLMVERAALPASAKLYSFGTAALASADGWSTAAPATLATGNGHVALASPAGHVTLTSPGGLYVPARRYDLLVLGVDAAAGPATVQVEARLDGTERWVALTPVHALTALERTAAGVSIPLRWPAPRAVAAQLRLQLTLPRGGAPVTIEHVAIYPSAPGSPQ